MADISRVDELRQVILEKLQAMQARHQQFSDLAGWRTAIEKVESSEVEKWWASELLKFEAMLDDASMALKCIPELTVHHAGRIISCSLESGQIREFGALRLGEELATVRALGRLERGTPRPVLLPADRSGMTGARATRLLLSPWAPPTAEQTLFIEEQVQKRIEDYLRWVASGVAVERWERER